MGGELALPHLALEPHDSTEAFSTEVETVPIEIVVLGLPAQRGLNCVGAAAAAIDHPFKHAHVLSKTRPGEGDSIVGAKPVDPADARRMRNCLAHREPMLEIVADVITAEGEHRERIAPYFADLAVRGSGRLRSHRRGLVNTVYPARGFDDQRNGIAAAGAEDESRYRNAIRVVPFGIERRALGGRDRKARIGVCSFATCLLTNLGRPWLPLPVGQS